MWDFLIVFMFTSLIPSSLMYLRCALQQCSSLRSSIVLWSLSILSGIGTSAWLIVFHMLTCAQLNVPDKIIQSASVCESSSSILDRFRLRNHSLKDVNGCWTLSFLPIKCTNKYVLVSKCVSIKKKNSILRFGKKTTFFHYLQKR